MSQSAVPLEMTLSAMTKPMTEMQEMMADMARLHPAHGMIPPLMTHPAAAGAAAAALGMAAASQMAGLMIGSVQGAMETSRRMGLPVAPVDALAGFRFLDIDWNAAMGESVAEEVTRTAERTSEAAKKAAAEIAEQSKADTANAANTVKRATASVAKTADTAADTAAKSGPAGAEQTTDVAKSAVESTMPTTEEAPAAPAMTQPREMVKPETPDDLKQIAGIGPKLEEVLNRLGIWSFAQIAGWSEAETAWVDDYLQFRGRIARDGWIDQAKKLAK